MTETSQKQISVNDFTKICRICLSSNQIIPISDIYYVSDLNTKTVAVELLELCLSLPVNSDDCLPQNLCKVCIEELYRIYTFKKQCHENDKFLRLVLEKSREEADLNKNRNEAQPSEEKEGTIMVKQSPKREKLKVNPLKCRDYPESFKSEKREKNHRKRANHPERGKGFIQVGNLHNHEKTHLSSPAKKAEVGSEQFKCEYCGKSFKRLTPFNVHLKQHNPDHKIDVVEKAETENETKRFFCNTCNKGYKAKSILKVHQLRHGEKSFLCSDCGKGFFTKTALQSHLKMHTGEKPHTCVICQKSFAYMGSFDRHMLIHTGQKPYSCTLCPKAFTQLSQLTGHSRTHSGERPYSCLCCGKSFALKGSLTVHMRSHTGEAPSLCSVCGKGFYNSSSMKKHKKKHK